MNVKDLYKPMSSDDDRGTSGDEFRDEGIVDGAAQPPKPRKSKRRSKKKRSSRPPSSTSRSLEVDDEEIAQPRSSSARQSASIEPPTNFQADFDDGVDEAVPATDEDTPPRQPPAQDAPPPRLSATDPSKKKKEINKDFKDVRETGRWGAISKREIYIVAAIAVLVVIGVVVTVVVLTTGGDDSAPPPPPPLAPPPPTTAPTVGPVLSAQEQLDLIRAATNENAATADSLTLLPEDVEFYKSKADDATNPPVVRAASWIMYNDPIDNEEWLLVRYSLATLYFTTNGGSWTNNDGWLSDSSVCSWYGVRCDRFNQRVEEIDLSENNMTGFIPNEVVMMPTLISLWLRRNDLSGNVPNLALGSLPSLSILYIEDNKLVGEITSDLAASGSLSKFHFVWICQGFLFFPQYLISHNFATFIFHSDPLCSDE